uniref:Uncharacterized protein n=1 Tax=Avena sativa TaxID=4498 RepID=A0ACD5Y1V2_AVESA
MALSVARSLVASAANKAASEAMDEVGLLMGVRTEIWYIKDELRVMQAFLRTAERLKDRYELVQVWAEQVEDLSYDIKYCLDEFQVHLGHPGCLHRLLKLRVRHEIALQIRNLKARVEQVSNRINRYSHLIMAITPGSINESKDERVDNIMDNDISIRSASTVLESELVGFSKPEKELIKLMAIEEKNGYSKLICVVGMAGLGKTALVRKIYESNVVNSFPCYAWIKVSQPFFRIGMLKDMTLQVLGVDYLNKFLEKHEGEALREEDLVNCLRKGLLEKRYFVILDDLRTIDDLKWIRTICFPISNSRGSRIIVTTRDIGIAKCSSESLIYYLEPLQVDNARTLLLRRTIITHGDMEFDEDERNMVTMIVKMCAGLPLALLTVGGLLATKRLSEWGSICTNLSSEFECNPSLRTLRSLVIECYYNLPSHLKPCLLYLGIFPRDFVIQMRRLIDRLIAEGLVTSRVGMDIDDVAESYLNELINRGFLQPSRVNLEGRVRSCQVNGLISDIIASVSRCEKFVYLTRDIIASAPEENFRHVAHHGRKCPKISMDWSHVRSFTVFGVSHMEPRESFFSAYLRMLSVLDLQDADCSITQKDISNIGLLRRLKYLNVRGHSNICELTGSVGKLHGLQYLDLRNSCITSLPTEVTKLYCLSSLRCSSSKTRIGLHASNDRWMRTLLCFPMVFKRSIDYSDSRAETGGVSVPRGIGDLKELQILEVVDIKRTSSRAIKELGELMRIRKLSVVTAGATKKKCKILGAAIENLVSLTHVSVDAGRSSIGWLHHAVWTPPPLLRTLKFHGYLGDDIPCWVGSLMHLVRIELEHSGLKEGYKVLQVLGALPKLALLGLSWKSYMGEELIFRAYLFPNLKKLDIIGLDELRRVSFEEDTSPNMEKIEISGCTFEYGITGVRHLARLQEISLGSRCQPARLGELVREVDQHTNNPRLRLWGDWSDHNLVDDAVQGSSTEAVVGECSHSQMPTGSDSSEGDLR